MKKEVEKCSLCGFCKIDCPIFQVSKNESVGPRGRMIEIKKDLNDLEFYRCSLCGACRISCPSGIKTEEEFQKFRERLVRAGIETPTNKQMIKNVKKYGNPFGKVQKGKVPKDLFCC